MSTTLQSEKVQAVLNRLHAEARANDSASWAQFEKFSPEEREALRADYRKEYGMLKNAFLPVGPELGRLLYLLATSARAKTIVEFGTSFGISTIYLAAALRDSGGGKLITSELELSKSQRAQAHLAEVGLGDLVEHRVGDALELLARDLGTVDFLLLDGAKPLYFRVLKLVEPALRKGAVIVADNVNTRNEKDMAEFTGYVREPKNGYVSVDVPLGDGIEVAMRV
jgi:predicted O-methyltransferase YrrM